MVRLVFHFRNFTGIAKVRVVCDDHGEHRDVERDRRPLRHERVMCESWFASIGEPGRFIQRQGWYIGGLVQQKGHNRGLVHQRVGTPEG